MKKRLIIDSHSHYSHKRFDSGRDALLSTLNDHGIAAVVEAAIGYDTNLRMMELCHKWPFVYMAAGVHPNCILDLELDEHRFTNLVNIISNPEHPKIIAVKTGLDYSRGKNDIDIKLQKKWLARFVQLAIDTHKPLVVHCRETEAYDDLIQILSDFHLPPIPGVIHCFGGNSEQAQKLALKGFKFGIGGMITKLPLDHELCDALKVMDLQNIVLETDAPFLKPTGLKEAGKRNSSLNIPFIVSELAKLRGESEDAIYDAAWKNTKALFPGIATPNN